jgi:hypothetical protein
MRFVRVCRSKVSFMIYNIHLNMLLINFPPLLFINELMALTSLVRLTALQFFVVTYGDRCVDEEKNPQDRDEWHQIDHLREESND